MKDITIWRFNLHTVKEGNKNQKKTHEEVFDFCKERGIIGTRMGIRWRFL